MLFDDLMVWLRCEYRRPSAAEFGHGSSGLWCMVMVIVIGDGWWTCGDCSGASVISDIGGCATKELVEI